MIPSATPIETPARTQQVARLARAQRRPPRRSGRARRGRGRARPARRGAAPDVVAGRLDRADELRPPDLVGQVPDRRHLGGEIHHGLLDARRALQEALDPVDARGAGHALDRAGRAARSAVLRSGRLHTPREYTPSRSPTRAASGLSSRSCPVRSSRPRSPRWGPDPPGGRDRGLVAVEQLTSRRGVRRRGWRAGSGARAGRPRATRRRTAAAAAAPPTGRRGVRALPRRRARRPRRPAHRPGGPDGLGPCRPGRGPDDPGRVHGELWRRRADGRQARRGPGGRRRGRAQSRRPRRPVPSGHRRRRHASAGTAAAGGAAGRPGSS